MMTMLMQVDVVLSDDRGFWSAIETFMSITKRPIVMTASDPKFASRFPCRVELLKLHCPQHVCSLTIMYISINIVYYRTVPLMCLVHWILLKQMHLM